MAYDFTKKKKEETTGQGVDYDAGVNDRALQMLRESAAAKRQAAVQPLTQKKNEALNAYLNRDDFKYDFNADALYQQYKDKYIQQGRQAMQDTMGQAAALTGGYGSSYAQSVGQQAYNAQLQNLNNVIPELYQLAYEKYQSEGNNLLQQYGLMADQEAEEYNRQYQSEQNAVSDYQWKQSFDYQKSRDAVADSQWQQSFDYQKAQNEATAKAESSKVTKEAAEAMALHGDYSGFAALYGMTFDQAKSWYLANYSNDTSKEPMYMYTDDDGLRHYYIDGKDMKFEEGVDPTAYMKNNANVESPAAAAYSSDEKKTMTERTNAFVNNLPTWEEVQRETPGYSDYWSYILTSVGTAYSKGQLTAGEAKWLIDRYGLWTLLED